MQRQVKQKHDVNSIADDDAPAAAARRAPLGRLSSPHRDRRELLLLAPQVDRQQRALDVHKVVGREQDPCDVVLVLPARVSGAPVVKSGWALTSIVSSEPFFVGEEALVRSSWRIRPSFAADEAPVARKSELWFRPRRSARRASTESCTMYWYTRVWSCLESQFDRMGRRRAGARTSFFCPMRCVRPTAWSSSEGCRSGSTRKTCDVRQ